MARKGLHVPLLSEQVFNGKPPVQAPRLPSQPRQRRRGLLAFGLLVVAGGGLLASHVVSQLGDRVPVVVMTRDVPVGQRIVKDDVTITMIGADETVAILSGRELDRVVGMVAAVDLKIGMIVQPKAVTNEMRPVAGQQLVPVALKPSRLPARGLQPGDVIAVVPTPEGRSAADDKAAVPITAVVDRTTAAADTDGLVVVDLLVDDSDGARLAEQAADGQIALVLSPRRP